MITMPLPCCEIFSSSCGDQALAEARVKIVEVVAEVLRIEGRFGPSLRWLDIQIRTSRIINRIHEGAWMHVSMAGRGRVPQGALIFYRP